MTGFWFIRRNELRQKVKGKIKKLFESWRCASSFCLLPFYFSLQFNPGGRGAKALKARPSAVVLPA
jgi:hypothetical protein